MEPISKIPAYDLWHTRVTYTTQLSAVVAWGEGGGVVELNPKTSGPWTHMRSLGCPFTIRMPLFPLSNYVSHNHMLFHGVLALNNPVVLNNSYGQLHSNEFCSTPVILYILSLKEQVTSVIWGHLFSIANVKRVEVPLSVHKA